MPEFDNSGDELALSVAVRKLCMGCCTTDRGGVACARRVLLRPVARTHAAAKVDALASNGMDEIEIPAFLRKQAD